ncbi:MAG: hypothetical protein JW860_14085 [Sedimentisphaerales bacterium]|nr:hypothetical protein [Sedimentisphaerales bacterium]
MDKVYIVARSRDKERLLDKLGDLGLVHLVPVDPGKAVADQQTMLAIENLELALQTLSGYDPVGDKADKAVMDVCREVIRIQRESAECAGRLSGLHQQAAQLELWGDVRLDSFEKLCEAGIHVQFFIVPNEEVGEIQAECVQVLSGIDGRRSLVAIVDRKDEADLPEGAELLPLPKRDRPSLRAEAAEIDDKIKRANEHLQGLSVYVSEMEEELARLRQQAKFSRAAGGGFTKDTLFALQGWGPEEKCANLDELLKEADIEAAVRRLEPDEDELPPTLIKYPQWTMPIKGLFDILSTFPGYRELDLSCFFMIALPLFAAMLIGDAGYGLVFMLPALLMYRKLKGIVGVEKINLLIVIGGATLIWGILTANYFGITPESMAGAGGYVQRVNGVDVPDYGALRAGSGVWSAIGRVMIAIAPLWRESGDAAREVLIKISFIFGCLHLVLAHLRQTVAFWPNQRAWSEIGWCTVLVSMLGVIWMLFFGAEQEMPVPPSIILGALVLGLVLVILFSAPSRNPAKRIGVGFASSLLPFIGTFSDTMSYIRLMAVGLASYYIAVAFNSLGASMAESATWFAAAPVIVFGHALNIALALIAIFAHGVRLNMLEFSNNAGVQWAGYAYAPFAKGK